MDITVLLFYVFSAFVVFSAIAVISARNPVYSVLWLIFAFFNCTGLFLLLGAEMLAMLLVIVYVGAVAVLFLFVVMMLNIKTASLKKGFQAYLPLGIILAFILFLEIAAITYNSSTKIDLKKANKVSESTVSEADKVDNIGIDAVKEAVENAVAKIEKIAVDSPKEIAFEDEAKADVNLVEDQADKKKSVNKNTNAHQIGNVLYTDYVLYFQTSGLILFVAMIGAIVLTLRQREGVRKQDISQQLNRNVKDTLEVVKVKVGEGVK